LHCTLSHSTHLADPDTAATLWTSTAYCTLPQDAYGGQMDRPNACIVASASVVVSIVDACLCNYPGKQFSNGRWCCGDMTHFDTAY